MRVPRHHRRCRSLACDPAGRSLSIAHDDRADRAALRFEARLAGWRLMPLMGLPRTWVGLSRRKVSRRMSRSLISPRVVTAPSVDPTSITMPSVIVMTVRRTPISLRPDVSAQAAVSRRTATTSSDLSGNLAHVPSMFPQAIALVSAGVLQHNPQGRGHKCCVQRAVDGGGCT